MVNVIQFTLEKVKVKKLMANAALTAHSIPSSEETLLKPVYTKNDNYKYIYISVF